MDNVDELKHSISVLTKQVSNLTSKIALLENKPKPEIINKDGIPVGMHIFSDVENVGIIELVVRKRDYQVHKVDKQILMNGKIFKSLSAAAEAVSNIKRKSGWVFWRNYEGKTLKELFKG